MSRLRVLHLVGSACDAFYCDLSRLYARDCLDAIASSTRYDNCIAYITPDRLWRFPASLSQDDIAEAKPMHLAEAVQTLTTKAIDVMLPQMFCIPGMTHYRALFDLLHIPYVGNLPDVMALAAHKARARAIAVAAGINVPRGELLRPGDRPTLPPPVVVKPANADNSLGVTLVNDEAAYHTAFQAAFACANEVLVEEYIELGREVRCGVIVRDGALIGLPLEEYRVSSQHPIRGYADKLQRVDDGELKLMAKNTLNAWIVDPADPVTAQVQTVAKQCHQAMGCRHYSLFDFRIDMQERPWFLEAGLYCSFSPKSVIVTMAQAAGISLDELLITFINDTVRANSSRGCRNF